MAVILRARQGDTLDGLLWRERNLGPEAIGPVLVANRGLAELGAVLPVGSAVMVPVAAETAPKTRAILHLWD